MLIDTTPHIEIRRCLLEEHLYTHVCFGGPLDGQEVTVRGEKGFILVRTVGLDDLSSKIRMVVVYDLLDDRFVARGEEVEYDPAKHEQAMLDGGRDVLAL